MSHLLPNTEIGLPSESLFRDHIYVAGEWISPSTDDRIPVIDSFTEKVLGHAPNAASSDVDLAVSAARDAFERWSRTSPPGRAAALERLIPLLERRIEPVARLWAREAGMPVTQARASTAALPLSTLHHYVELLRTRDFEETIGNTRVIRESIGVVAAITPWNYPFSQILIKTVSALAAGCTVVAKPSEVAPLCGYQFAEIVEEADLPPGVFNLVGGDGPGTGEALASNPGVAAVSFTGSTRVGQRILELAAPDVKRVTLELGGKSAMVVLPDADLEDAIAATMMSCFRNNGQTCTSLTRLVVPTAAVGVAERLTSGHAEHHVLGDPLDESTSLGPLVSAGQRDRVRRYIRSGVEEGARLVTGGSERPDGLEHGFFVRPTVFSDVRVDMTIAQEEIFGPVQSVISYETVDQAIAIANATPYGLAASVWSGEEAKAFDVARRLRAGTISVNGGPFNPEAPYGGFGRSGLGRELGRWGIDEFVELKAIHLPG